MLRNFAISLFAYLLISACYQGSSTGIQGNDNDSNKVKIEQSQDDTVGIDGNENDNNDVEINRDDKDDSNQSNSGVGEPQKSGAQEEINGDKTGIQGDNNDNNNVIIADNITVNDVAKSIAQTRIVPKDILRSVRPDASMEFVKQLLGQPNFQSPYVWLFDNAYIEVGTQDGLSVDAVTLVKASMEDSDSFEIYPLSYELGSLQYTDVKGHCGEPKKDYSAKFYSMLTECSFGNPGGFFYFEFGLYEGGRVQYPKPFSNDIEAGPFNYVSIARDRERTSSIFYSYLR